MPHIMMCSKEILGTQMSDQDFLEGVGYLSKQEKA